MSEIISQIHFSNLNVLDMYPILLHRASSLLLLFFITPCKGSTEIHKYTNTMNIKWLKKQNINTDLKFQKNTMLSKLHKH